MSNEPKQPGVIQDRQLKLPPGWTDQPATVWNDVPEETLKARSKGIDPETAYRIETADELGLFLLLNGLAATFSQMAGDLRDPAVHTSPQCIAEIGEAAMKAQQVVGYATAASRRFGVQPFDPDTHKATESFFMWMKWWRAFIQGLAPEDWETIQTAINQGEDTSVIRPPGTWDVIEDGIIPASWLVCQTVVINDDEIDDVFEQEFAQKYRALAKFVRPQDQLWTFGSNPILVHPFGTPTGKPPFEQGYCIVRNHHPIAKLISHKQDA